MVSPGGNRRRAVVRQHPQNGGGGENDPGLFKIKDMTKTRKGLRSAYSKRFKKSHLISSGRFSKLYTVYLENRIINDGMGIQDKADSSSTIDERMHHFAEYVVERYFTPSVGISSPSRDKLIEDYLKWEQESFPMDGGCPKEEVTFCTCEGVDITGISKNKAGIYYHDICHKPMYNSKKN